MMVINSVFRELEWYPGHSRSEPDLASDPDSITSDGGGGLANTVTPEDKAQGHPIRGNSHCILS